MSKQFHGQPQHDDERKSLIGNSWNVTVVTWLLAQLGYQLGLCPLLTPQQAVQATAPGRSVTLGGLLQRQSMRKLPKGPVKGEYDLVSKLLNLVSLKGEDIMVQASTEETLRYHRLRASTLDLWLSQYIEVLWEGGEGSEGRQERSGEGRSTWWLVAFVRASRLDVCWQCPIDSDAALLDEDPLGVLGLKRFITARKESTANVAHLGIGNFRMTFYEDQKTRRLSLNHLFHMMVKWLTHLQEPERSGFAYNFLESRFFNSLCSTIILMHAVVVTLASDWEVNNLEGAVPESYQTLELVFLGFYAAELALRLYVHRCFFFFGEAAGWNWFDFCLVVFSFMDIIYLTMQMTATEATGANVAFMRLFRLFKITKILRTIRIIKVFRELSMMVESFTKCIVAMFWGLVLLVFLLYIFAPLGLCLRNHGFAPGPSAGREVTGRTAAGGCEESVWFRLGEHAFFVHGGDRWQRLVNVLRHCVDVRCFLHSSLPALQLLLCVCTFQHHDWRFRRTGVDGSHSRQR
ncbi:Voltage-dependent calcium channel type D subunit alpha-1 (DmCa1D) [Durusdinium trenchii]|uniref:Voltage-dependent calcium channel type D subunit alpha-1 (DmCa1D) n=1 Tax=Durusdinium trenchii TaxID=1381693 RepID=A0ABP0IWH7_9DINO